MPSPPVTLSRNDLGRCQRYTRAFWQSLQGSEESMPRIKLLMEEAAVSLEEMIEGPDKTEKRSLTIKNLSARAGHDP